MKCRRECARVRVRSPMINTLIFEKAGLLNNYYTPVLKSIKQKIYEGTKSYEGTYFRGGQFRG